MLSQIAYMNANMITSANAHLLNQLYTESFVSIYTPPPSPSNPFGAEDDSDRGAAAVGRRMVWCPGAIGSFHGQ